MFAGRGGRLQLTWSFVRVLYKKHVCILPDEIETYSTVHLQDFKVKISSSSNLVTFMKK